MWLTFPLWARILMSVKYVINFIPPDDGAERGRETAAEGASAGISQAEGSAPDGTLESGRQSAPTGAKLSGNPTEAHGRIAMRFFAVQNQKEGMEMEGRKTPLYDRHTAAGGKIVPFAGWLLPVQYSGVIAEHRAVRSACGLFDVSHMGELVLRGADALANVNNLMTNDFSGMADGQARYSPMCYEDGGVVDDLIVYRCSDTAYLIVVNAANRDKDAGWIRAHLTGDCAMEDISDQVAQLALQGPEAESILRTLTGDIPEKNYTAVLHGTVDGRPCLVSRTGYTGEDGFELYCAPGDAPALWDALIAAGAVPCGLGARDTLRLEAAMPLYGHELSPEINPYEAGLGIFVKLDKDGFIGKAALEQARPVRRRRVGLKMTGRGIAREECPVYDGEKQIGVVTSGTHCPWLGCAVAMALVDAGYKEPGTPLQVDVRGRRVEAEVVKPPFYKRG